MRNLIFTLLFALVFSGIAAQNNAYKIDLTVPDQANEQIYLAYHYNNKQYIKDTVTLDSKGFTSFTGEEPLQAGVYLVVFPKLNNKYFEILVKDQNFSIVVDDINKLNEPTFKNSPDNTLFYKDMKKMGEIRKQSQDLEAQIKSAEGDRKTQLENRLKAISDNFLEYREKLIEDNADYFYADLLGLMREIKIPDAPEGLDENEVRNFNFNFYRSHYWDYTDFSEEGIVRTPIFPSKLTDFFDKYTIKSQDSLIAAADYVLAKAEANPIVFQYTLVTLVNKYANSKVMGDDAVYVHLVKNYYATDKAWWAEKESVDKMIERADALAPILIGEVSPDLVLRDTTVNNFVQLHKVNSDFTIVYIWDPDCGHCKKATPKLKTFYDAHHKDGIEVYAITTSNIENIDEWKSFIKKHNLNWINVGDLYHQTKFRDLYDISSTPQVFILDSKKEIIAKRIGVEQIEGFFHKYFKSKKDDRMNLFEDSPVNNDEAHSDDDDHNH